jgi:hypothetical protein
MISRELYKCAIKYYNLHNELNIDIRINNINTIFGISRASFFRFQKNDNENIKKNVKLEKVNTL